MALSEVERSHIEEEEKLRAEVREQIQQAKFQKLRRPMLIFISVMFVILIILLVSLERSLNSSF